jgi:3-hydroxyacyl-CoA dehydrogenase
MPKATTGAAPRVRKRTVHLHKEVPGHAGNRLQAALAYEVYRLVVEGAVKDADGLHASRG